MTPQIETRAFEKLRAKLNRVHPSNRASDPVLLTKLSYSEVAAILDFYLRYAHSVAFTGEREIMSDPHFIASIINQNLSLSCGNPMCRADVQGVDDAAEAVHAALLTNQDRGGPVMAELPEVTWWNGVRGPASNLAQCLETYAKIPPGADRDKWAMDAAAKWIREVIDLNANPVLPDFTEISPGVYVRRDYSPEQLEKLLRRPDSLIASALSAARSNAAPKADGHEEHYGDGWDLRLPDTGGRS
jgi:hypothetical protein